MSSNRLRRRSQDGFTLIELTVALSLLMVVLLASLPAFLGMLRTAVSTKVQTQAKNINQQRLEQLKDLRYHIDRQNGPFLDLLDIYFTNANTSGATIAVTVDGSVQTGLYVPTAAATATAPAGPYYRVTVARVLAGKTFTQTVYSRFLGPSGAPISMTAFENAYDSQTIGRDAAPAAELGVTLVTSWADGTRTKTLSTSTRIVDGRPEAAVIQTQARAAAVRISSTATDGTTLQLVGGVADADGTQSTGSSVAGFSAGAQATRTGFPAVTGKSVSFNLPTAAVTTVNNSGPQTAASGCSWYGFASSGVDNGTGSLAGGLPKAPTTVDNTTPPTMMSGYLSANGGGACGILSYDNLAGGGVARPTTTSDPIGHQMGAAPYVRIPDNISGSGPVVSGSAYVTSNPITSAPQKSAAGAASTLLQPVVLFPNNPDSGGMGLVRMRLTSASLTCASSTTTGVLGAASATYAFELGWWGKMPSDPGTTPVWHTTTWTYNSATNAAPVRTSGPAWDPANTLLSNGLRLSDLIAAPGAGAAPSVLTTGATSGLRGFSDGIFSITTASTTTNELQPGFSAIKVAVGQMTCVADDQR